MPVLLYRDKNFEGPVIRLQPGFYSGRKDLEGTTRGSSYGEDLDNEISSVRVDQGYIAVLYGGYGESASSGGARTLVGPTEVADLSVIGMNDKASSIKVILYEPFQAAIPRDFGVTLFNNVHQARPGSSGIHLGQGDFDRTRLDSDEVLLGSSGVQSLCVGPNTIAVLYEGATFDSTLDSVLIGPNTCVQDVADIGMEQGGGSKVNSIRVLYAAVPTAAGTPTSVASGLSTWERAMQSLQDRKSSTLPTRYHGSDYLDHSRRDPVADAAKIGHGPSYRVIGVPAPAQSGSSSGQVQTSTSKWLWVVLFIIMILLAAILLQMRSGAGGQGASANSSPPTPAPGTAA